MSLANRARVQPASAQDGVDGGQLFSTSSLADRWRRGWLVFVRMGWLVLVSGEARKPNKAVPGCRTDERLQADHDGQACGIGTAPVAPMDYDDLLDEPLTAPEGIQTFGWPVMDPATAQLAAAVDDLARVVKENLQWQRNITSILTASLASGRTRNSTATGDPSTGFATDTEVIRHARTRLSQSKKR